MIKSKLITLEETVKMVINKKKQTEQENIELNREFLTLKEKEKHHTIQLLTTIELLEKSNYFLKKKVESLELEIKKMKENS